MKPKMTSVVVGILVAAVVAALVLAVVAVEALLYVDWGNETETAQISVEALQQAADAQSEALTLLVLYLWSVQVDLGSLVGLAPEDICMPSLPLEDDYFLRVIEAVAAALGQEAPTMTREMLVALDEQEEGVWDRYCGISAMIRDTREEAE